MTNAKLWTGEFLGVPTIEFSCGGYEGSFTVEGANLVRFEYVPRHIFLLHMPKDESALRKQKIYGIPLLFFPNRIKDGVFQFEGKTYQFPINSENNMHIHGFLDGYTDWKVVKQEAGDNLVNLTFAHTIQQGSEMYKYFGFEISIVYENIITPDGLYQNITFANKSDKTMPFGFAYHTTFNIPFNNSPEDAFRVGINLKQRYELDKCIPTGRLLPLDTLESQTADEGMPILARTLDNLYLADETQPNTAVITDTNTGEQIVYETDRKFRHWILYNADAKQRFLSVEPQTCCTNAVNSTMPTANLITLAPGKVITLTTKLYVKEN